MYVIAEPYPVHGLFKQCAIPIQMSEESCFNIQVVFRMQGFSCLHSDSRKNIHGVYTSFELICAISFLKGDILKHVKQ